MRDMHNFLIGYYKNYEQNPYDHAANKSGIINFGTAQSNLCSDILNAKMREKYTIHWTSDCQSYFNYAGVAQLSQITLID
ncbi:1-aminocyclopropane-1-carboxylate synthase-like protein 1 [Tubulanus polymorphus]|uniref:1-aminocyclopropane-1-carboxylate synthase-like protein 1 n=1 Tax=Tubulanus polymorphus TaxID=672921 RepID=UPI003DA3A8F6